MTTPTPRDGHGRRNHTEVSLPKPTNLKSVPAMCLEADNLAMDLLMPEKAFRAAWILYPSLRQIAEYFEVPLSVANVRAMQLGLGYEVHE